jgi:hypothetical protein
LSGLFASDDVFVRYFVLCLQFRRFEAADFSHDLAHDSCVAFPFLFFAFLPVVLPEILVWLEDGQLLNSENRETNLKEHNSVVRNGNGITMHRSNIRQTFEG